MFEEFFKKIVSENKCFLKINKIITVIFEKLKCWMLTISFGLRIIIKTVL